MLPGAKAGGTCYQELRQVMHNSLVGIAGHAEIDMEFSSMLRGCSKIISLTQRG